MRVLILLTSLLLQQVTDNINAATMRTEQDPVRIEQLCTLSENGSNAIVYLLELFFKTPVTEEEIAGILSLQKSDGSFRDVDYADPAFSQCSQTWHAVRFQRLAVYHRLHPGNKKVTRALHRALAYWGKHPPVTRSWYYNQVNIPKAFGPGLLLFKEEMSRRELQWASTIMHKAQLNRTGQNLVWESGNLLIAALLDEDEALLRQTAQIIQSELGESVSDQGLQPDRSFLQHGAQLQFGNYGLSFVVSQAWWARIFKGTALQLPAEKEAILKDYICKGIGRTVWNGYMDMSALGRQVFPSSQRSKALCLQYAMEDMGLSAIDVEAGPRYYPRADFGNYRGEGWYASIRMQSARTQGYEEINGENQKGYFSADGAVLVRRSGAEYDDVTPVWNWRHVPGTTAWDDGTPLWGTHTQLPYNKSSRVFGLAKGDVLVAAMEYERDGVFARKIYAFFPEGILCMGGDIRSSSDAAIVTTVEQCRVHGPVTHGPHWVHHAGITYLALGERDFSAAEVVRATGSWRVAAPNFPDTPVEDRLFEIYYAHGTRPGGESYAYFIDPTAPDGPAAAAFAASGIALLSDASARVGKNGFSVDWEKETIIIDRL